MSCLTINDFAIGDRFLITARGYKDETMEVVRIYDNAIAAVDIRQLGGDPERQCRQYFPAMVLEIYSSAGTLTKVSC